MILLKPLVCKTLTGADKTLPARRNSAVSAALHYLYCVTKWTYSVLLNWSSRINISGGITWTELCRLIQKSTLGTSSLHFIVVSWHSHCSSLKFLILCLFICQGEALSAGRMLLNPVVVPVLYVAVRTRSGCILFFHYCESCTFGFKTVRFQTYQESDVPPV